MCKEASGGRGGYLHPQYVFPGSGPQHPTLPIPPPLPPLAVPRPAASGRRWSGMIYWPLAESRGPRTQGAPGCLSSSPPVQLHLASMWPARAAPCVPPTSGHSGWGYTRAEGVFPIRGDTSPHHRQNGSVESGEKGIGSVDASGIKLGDGMTSMDHLPPLPWCPTNTKSRKEYTPDA